MTIRQLLALYNRHSVLRVTGHALFWLVLWVFTENHDFEEPYASRLLWWLYPLASFYILFYWPGPLLWRRRRYGRLGLVVLGLVLGIEAVQYWSEKIIDPQSDYFLPAFETYGFLAIFLSGRYFFYVVFNGLLVNMAVPGVLKAAKLLYEQQLTRQRTEQLTQQLQLDVLLAQVSPHFLFNTLNNLYGLVLQNDPRAQTISQQLAALVHYSHELAGRKWVTLEEEIQFTEDFLALARLRYGCQVTIESQWDLDSPATDHIPPLLLLPLVENAFKHGPDQTIGAAWVQVQGRVQTGEIVLTVANSRAEATRPPEHQPSGLGLANLHERLKLLYPETSPLVLRPTATTFVATLRLPLRAAAGKWVSVAAATTVGV